jgi:hypothetical protein
MVSYTGKLARGSTAKILPKKKLSLKSTKNKTHIKANKT